MEIELARARLLSTGKVAELHVAEHVSTARGAAEAHPGPPPPAGKHQSALGRRGGSTARHKFGRLLGRIAKTFVNARGRGRRVLTAARFHAVRRHLRTAGSGRSRYDVDPTGAHVGIAPARDQAQHPPADTVRGFNRQSQFAQHVEPQVTAAGGKCGTTKVGKPR